MTTVAFIIAALLVFVATPLVIRIALRYNLVDDPKLRKHPAQTHTIPVPRAGGLALYIGIVVALLIVTPVTKITLSIIAALSILTLVGLIDDHRDVNPYIRIGTNTLACLIVVAAGIGIPFITNPLTGGIIHLDTWRITFGSHSIIVLADIFALIWISWVMNIVGWSAGVDGQMPGFVVVSALTLGALSLRFSAHDISQTTTTILAFITAGAFLGFLPWNFYPQKIMPGYGGKTIAGFLLGVLSILSYGKLGTLLLVLGVPMIDAVSTLIRRMGKGKSPVWADAGHFHHQLLRLGWGKRRIALFYTATSAILGVISLNVNSTQKIFAFLLIGLLVGGFLVWVNYFLDFSKHPDRDSG